MGMDESQDEMLADGRCYVRLFTVCGLPHHPARLSFLVPVCHRCVHEQLPIGSSFCSPTPALTITLAAHLSRSHCTMYGNDVEGDFFLRAWQIINEISEQLTHNQKFTASLLSQTESVKVRSS
jgi:hypothetical protein